MCTVTLIPVSETSKEFILTSNRDEAGFREAVPPDFYTENGVELLYPKEKLAGGSWIGLSSRSRLICLLNGGFENHKRNPPYRLSRGVVLKDLLTAEVLLQAMNSYDLNKIEPFTIIAVDWVQDLNFFELVWDGKERHIKHLDKKEHLWSSSPLYSTEMKKLRENWFSEFQKKSQLSAEDLWEFHHTAGIGDKDVDVIMDRGFIKTQSITQIIKSGDEVLMKYEDLKTREVTEKGLKS